MALDISELNTRGWIYVDGISSQADLLDLGMSIGSPVRTPNGELVKEIRRLPIEEAPPGSQSALYGAGPFPLHTDTVFWPLPVKYVLLRGYGDTRRPTTVKSFSNLVEDCDKQFHADAGESIWLVSAGSVKFYCSLQFRDHDAVGWRYDADLMHPANEAAVRVHNILRPLVMSHDVEPIMWTGNKAVVLSNWTTLHGRGLQPQNEGVRVVERLYVR